MDHFIYFPRGFRIKSRQEYMEFSDGDGEVTELWNRMHTVGKFDTTDPSLSKQVLSCVIRLIDDPYTFIRNQQSNHHVDDVKWGYLYDLLKFIKTGERGMSTEGLLRMVVDDAVSENNHTDRINVNRRLNIVELNGKPSRDLSGVVCTSKRPMIETWFSRVGSIEEIVCTLYVLFGKKT